MKSSKSLEGKERSFIVLSEGDERQDATKTKFALAIDSNNINFEQNIGTALSYYISGDPGPLTNHISFNDDLSESDLEVIKSYAGDFINSEPPADNDLAEKVSIDIFVSGGQHIEPFYEFYLDSDGNNKISNLTLEANKKYIFKVFSET